MFWDAADKRVKRAREGRYDMVRAGYQRADLAALDELGVHATPEDLTLARAELSAALHFAALLEPRERARLPAASSATDAAARWARRPSRASSACRYRRCCRPQRAIEAKRERFATIYAAGRLCGYLQPGVAALAEGDPAAQQAVSGRELAARVHLEIERCPTCTADYLRQLRYLRARASTRRSPRCCPPRSDERVRSLGRGARDWLPDWAARAARARTDQHRGQLLTGGAGRGLGTAAAAKLATFCLAGAGAVGACVATGVLPLRRDRAAAAGGARHPDARRRGRRRSRASRACRTASATPTPTPTPRPAQAARRPAKSSSAKTQGGTGPRSHEQTPASPAPANAAPGGASEFDPTYQPNAPAAPAPVPAAPGASEFS